MPDSISVVIPTYNEKEAIVGTIETIFRELPHLKEIIVVDDDSPDKTWQRVEEIQKENRKIKLIRRHNKKGLPGAIWDGILKAEGDVILWLDADFLSLPGTLSKLAGSLSGYDIVVASRYVPEGKDARKERLRALMSCLFNYMARFILRTSTQDLTSGYCIARKEVFKKIALSGIYGEYFLRFMYQAEGKGLEISEMPYICLSRLNGKSKTSGNNLVFIKYCLIYMTALLKIRLCGK